MNDKVNTERVRDIYGNQYEIETDVLNVYEEIRDRFPELKIKYLPPESGFSVDDPPYIIVDVEREHIVLRAWTLDRSIIEKLYQMQDADINKAVDLANQAARKELAKQFEEARAEPRDIVKHAISSPKGTYSFVNSEGDKVVISDSEPPKKPKPLILP